MDIQELVESRIEELRSRSTGAERDVYPAHGHDGIDGVTAPAEDLRPAVNRESYRGERPPAIDRRDRGFDPEGVPRDFCELVDAALAEIANRVMEITEQVTEDHTRIERELLDSRLQVLQSAEVVMDMALRLRSRALELMAGMDQRASGMAASNQRAFTSGLEKISPVTFAGAGQDRSGNGERASMHEIGVAALFKKTR